MSKMDKLFQNVTFSTDIIGNDNLVCVLKVANHQNVCCDHFRYLK